jgi:hypothetical protein
VLTGFEPRCIEASGEKHGPGAESTAISKFVNVPDKSVRILGHDMTDVLALALSDQFHIVLHPDPVLGLFPMLERLAQQQTARHGMVHIERQNDEVPEFEVVDGLPYVELRYDNRREHHWDFRAMHSL